MSRIAIVTDIHANREALTAVLADVERRRAERLPWLAGAVLLAVVVVKLVFVDMSTAEGLARIVAFIGVGVMMLLIGYFVPLPPRKEARVEAAP